MSPPREGSLEAPTRHPLDWKSESFYDTEDLFAELERVYDICHGCRRCVSLCRSFPTLFDLVDESETFEVDGVAKSDYWKVVDQCYLCDLCYMTKCPYVPPHEWNVDFPHLMLRAKAVKYRDGRTKKRDELITRTDAIGKLATLPVIVNVVNGANRTPALRGALEATLGVHREARLPKYDARPLRKRVNDTTDAAPRGEPAGPTQGRVILFGTCYGNYNEPGVGEDLAAVFEHNAIPVRLPPSEQCCGMPRLELGDLESVERAKDANVPMLAKLVDDGWDIIAPVPSCVLMFKQELPLMFPDDPLVLKVKEAMYDPFEYLALRERAGKLRKDFNRSLGTVAYHAACHQRVQNIGPKTKDMLELAPDTEVKVIERCSGHDGTYAVKREYHDDSMRILRPVLGQVKRHEADHHGSDCPMAGQHIANGLNDGSETAHPISLLRLAYGI